MGRRKKDDGTFWLALGLYGAGWVVCKAVKCLFSLPKIPNPPPQSIVPKEQENEYAALSSGIFFLIVSIILILFSEKFALLLIIPLIFFTISYTCRHKRLKKEKIFKTDAGNQFISNKAPVKECMVKEKHNMSSKCDSMKITTDESNEFQPISYSKCFAVTACIFCICCLSASVIDLKALWGVAFFAILFFMFFVSYKKKTEPKVWKIKKNHFICLNLLCAVLIIVFSKQTEVL